MRWINDEQPSLSTFRDPVNNRSGTLPEFGVSKYVGAYFSNFGSSYVSSVEVPPMVLIELPGTLTVEEVQSAWDQWFVSNPASSSKFADNAILNPWWDPVPSNWMTITSLPDGSKAASAIFDSEINVADNFWGTSSEALVENAVFGYSRDFNLNPIAFSPLGSAPEQAYPFMASIAISGDEGATVINNSIGAEATTWTLTFNRDMNQSVDPFVTFGPEEPFTDFVVEGAWLDARTWQGQVAISPVATDGYQYVRVSGAVAADDPWLVTGVDKRRFRFEVITSGVESLNLQASGGEGFVDLSWNQDDYDTLLGFNIYRSTSPDSGFIRINQTLVGNGERSYRDTGVDPGVQYYYYFTVALDGSESEPSKQPQPHR